MEWSLMMKRLDPKTAAKIPSLVAEASPSAQGKVVLTVKEQECLEWAVRGKSAWEVSRILDKSEAAVNFHLCNIRRKFGVNSLRSALVKAIEQGLIVLH